MTNSGSSILSRLDSIPVGCSYQVKLVGFLCVAFFLEYADLNTFSNVAPALIKYWNISVGTVAQITAATYFGMGIGSFLGGWIADKFGRKWSLLSFILLYSLCSLVNAVLNTAEGFMVARFFTGLFLSATIITAVTYVAEFFPANQRGKMQAIIMGVGFIGIPAVAFFARFVIDLGPDGWRWVFVAGAAGIFLIPIGIFQMKESPRWYLSKGMVEKAHEVVADLERNCGITPPDLKAIQMAEKEAPEYSPKAVTATGKFLDLFKGKQLQNTLIVTSAATLFLIGAYGFLAWVPTLLFKMGISLTKSVLFASIMMIGNPLGALSSAIFSDRVGRQRMITITALLIAVSGVLYGFSREPWQIITMGFCTVFLIQASAAYVYSYLPENFSTNIRSLGGGFANGVARFLAMLSPLAISLIFNNYGYVPVFVFIAGCFCGVALLVFIWGIDTRGTLEQVSQRQAG
ncbi:MAG: MFS transporter [Geobacteraceae bacterium]